jgi:hypothetical protein
LTIFFVLRALGRFLGAWLLQRFEWTLILMVFAAAFSPLCRRTVRRCKQRCVPAATLRPVHVHAVPTLNSKGISCFARMSTARWLA